MEEEEEGERRRIDETMQTATLQRSPTSGTGGPSPDICNGPDPCAQCQLTVATRQSIFTVPLLCCRA